jgi:hypothetical protein
MLETLLVSATIGLSSLVTVTRPGTLPVAAMTRDKAHPVIVHIVSRNQTLTVKSGQTGLLYSLTGTDGKVLIADATPQKFAELQPEMYKQLRQFMAVKNDMTDIGAFDGVSSRDSRANGPIMADARVE